jgi:hypothetical protein
VSKASPVRDLGRVDWLAHGSYPPTRTGDLSGELFFETPPPLHGALLSIRGRRERCRAFSSPMEAEGYAVMKI